MEDTLTFCPNCFAEKGTAGACPHCRYEDTSVASPIALVPGTLLHDHYVIGRILGRPGGFGITYLAYHNVLQTRVAIKEYFPREWAGRVAGSTTIVPHSGEDGHHFRYGLEQFLTEARTLAQIDHPNVVRVRDFFEANGTGYLVMDYYPGMSLAEYLDEHGGRVSEKLGMEIMMPVLDGLRTVHARSVLHRDIDPHNIYLTEEGRPLLLDFGAARVAAAERSRSLSIILKPGFAPYEQYYSRGKQGPWTDVYACAATLYRMVAGEVPPEAIGRTDEDTLEPLSRLVRDVSATFNDAVMQGLAVRAQDRPQSVEAFQTLLLDASDRQGGDGADGRHLPPPGRPVALEMASRASRLGAAVLDALLIGVPAFFLAVGVEMDGGELVAYSVLGLLAVLIFQAVLLTKYGQTVGKRAVQVRIVREDTGANGGFGVNVLLRSVVAGVIFAIPAVGTLLGVANVLFIFRQDRRCIHDFIAGTRVVLAPAAASGRIGASRGKSIGAIVAVLLLAAFAGAILYEQESTRQIEEAIRLAEDARRQDAEEARLREEEEARRRAEQEEEARRRSEQEYHSVSLRNSCNRRIAVAVLYYDPEGHWMRRGWWAIDSGNLVNTDIRTKNRHIYFYANEYGNWDFTWNGVGKEGSVTRTVVADRFDFRDDDPVTGSDQRTVSFFLGDVPSTWGTFTQAFTCN